MKATLLVGDYLFVSKYSYGYSHFSLPFSPPIFNGRIFGSQPERGDVVVFRLPKDTSILVSPATRAQQTVQALTSQYQTVKQIAPGADYTAILEAATT